MKKIILTASSLIFAVSLFVGINAYTNSNPVNDLLLANVEALAWGEGGGCPTCGNCSGYYNICESQEAQFWSEIWNHCSAGGEFIVTIYGFC